MTATRVLLLALVALACSIPAAIGHGFMYEPRARNVIHGEDCPHCLSAGGPYEVSAGSTLTWPAGNRGICGDMVGDRKHEPGGVYGPAGIQATYAPGSEITISLLLSTQHGGRHVFRLCDRTDADEACLAAHVLERADGTGPYTWTPPEGSSGPAIPASGYSPQGSQLGESGEVYTMQYRLPAGLSCSACTLQWWWTTANSCDLPGSPFGGSDMMLCDTPAPGPYPEEFMNCADIAIVGDAAPATPMAEPIPHQDPTPTPEPIPTPLQEPTPDPEPTPTPEPTPVQQPTPSPEPTPTPEPTPDQEPTPTPEPTPDQEPTPTPEPTLEPATPAAEPTPPASQPSAPDAEPAVLASPAVEAAPAPAAATSAFAPAPAPSYSRKMNPGAAIDAPAVCQANGPGVYTAPWSCAHFVLCGPGGIGAAERCDEGTLWDDTFYACAEESQVDCGSRARP